MKMEKTTCVLKEKPQESPPATQLPQSTSFYKKPDSIEINCKVPLISQVQKQI